MELLAPVGSPEALYAAVAAGADAVYFGLNALNARAKAQGFDENNVKAYVEYCHLHGVKTYVTLNTEIKNSETEKLRALAEACAEAGTDAFIVADIGAVGILADLGVPLHASTQMGVHNTEGAKYLERYGFTRVVVARETLLSDVMKIKESTSLEVEFFVHGALCVAFSGACLASAVRTGDSGNRGRCMQPCRLKYSSSFGKEGYLLSPKDQCLITELDSLAAARVDSLKIEGRLKQPHYVYETVRRYRAALDGKTPDRDDIDALKRAFNRGGFTRGYNFDDTRGIMYPKVQNNIGVTVGTVISADRRGAVVALKEDIRKGDGLKLISASGEEKGGFEALSDINARNALLPMPVGSDAAKGDSVAKTFDAATAANAVTEPQPLPIALSVRAHTGERLSVTAQTDGRSFTAYGPMLEGAEGKAADSDGLARAANRLGGSGFCAKDISADCDGRCFVPASALNAARRSAVEGLRSELLTEYAERQRKARATLPYSAKPLSLSAMYEADDLAKADVHAEALVYAPREFGKEQAEAVNGYCSQSGSKVYIHMPLIARGGDIGLLRGFLDAVKDSVCGLVCDNWYAFELAREYGMYAVAGIKTNICSDAAFRASGANAAIASAELSYAEYRGLGFDALCFAYGALPVMTLTHCPVQLNTGCTCADCAYDGDFVYRDKREEYRISRTKLRHCTFDLYNPQTVNALAKYSGRGLRPFVSLSGIDAKLSDIAASTASCGGRTTSGLLGRGVK